MCLCGINFQILLCTLVFGLIYVFYLMNKSEQFDEKITRATKVNCGMICTKTLGCNGFMEDDYNNICYLSKTPIVGAPDKSPFKDSYDKNSERCNKISAITDTEIASDLDIINNASYNCTPNESSNEQTLKVYDGAEKKITSKLDLPYLDVSDYTYVDAKWGEEINLGDNINLVQNDKKTNVTIMTEHDEEFLGQYMYPHKCVTNISQSDCMKNCINDERCIGTEWNHLYVKKIDDINKTDADNDGFIDTQYGMYKDVCCPKIQIKKVIPRREEFKYGHFYLKETADVSDPNFINNIYIKI